MESSTLGGDTAWAMSEENIDTLRAAFDAFNRGDLEGAFVNLAPDFEYVSSGWLPDSDDSYRGPDKFRQFLGWLSDEFDDARLEANEFIDAGDALRDDGTVVNLVSSSRWPLVDEERPAESRPAGTSGMCGRFGMARL